MTPSLFLLLPQSDLLLCETMSSVREAAAAAEAADTAGKPIWVSWTLHEDGSGNLRSSETITQAVEALNHIKNLDGCLLNCSSNESICAALPAMRAALSSRPGGGDRVRLGCYANGFVTVKAGAVAAGAGAEYQQDLTPDVYLAQAEEWVRLGATIIGGCCGVFPEHIAVLAAKLN